MSMPRYWQAMVRMRPSWASQFETCSPSDAYFMRPWTVLSPIGVARQRHDVVGRLGAAVGHVLQTMAQPRPSATRAREGAVGLAREVDGSAQVGGRGREVVVAGRLGRVGVVVDAIGVTHAPGEG